MRPPRARTVLAIGVWLVVGLVVTVGVAWGVAYRGPYMEDACVVERVERPEWPDVPAASWRDSRPEGGEVLIARMQVCDRAWVGRPSVNSAIPDDFDYFTVEVWRSGWPRPALRATRLEERPSVLALEVKKETWRDGLVIPWRTSNGDGTSVSLPLRPCFAGLFVDAFLFAALARGTFGLLQLSAIIRRRVRRRAGQGVGCGYDRRGIGVGAACPECGRVVKAEAG
jgi:hypothetical protein